MTLSMRDAVSRICYLPIYVHLSTYQDASGQRDGHRFQAGRRARHAGGIHLQHDAGDDYDYGQRAHISRQGSRSGLAQDRILASSADHQIQDRGPAGPGRLARRAVGRQNGNVFPLNETDENKAMRALLLQHPIEEAASPSDREIDANQKSVMSDHDKNLFIEQHKDGYAILRGGVKEPLAVEPTQDAAIEKARKLNPDAAIHVERFQCRGRRPRQVAADLIGVRQRRVSSASSAPGSPAGRQRGR